MAATSEPSGGALGSSDVAAVSGASSLPDNPSSYMLKLFQHQSIITHANRNDPTHRTPSEPPIYTSTLRVLNILEISTLIATYLLPRKALPRNVQEDDEVRTHRSLSAFGRVCTSFYISAMRVLYKCVFWLPSLWWVLVDKYATLGYPFTDMVVNNHPILLLILRLQFDDGAILKDPEGVVAYKFRRFLFITAQVRALNIDNADFPPAILQYVSSLLPKHRNALLPGLRTASWMVDEYLVPTFLSSSSGISESRASSPSPTANDSESDSESPDASQSLKPWLPFAMDTIRTLNLQMHTLISPVDHMANHDLFLASLQQLQNQCRSAFPRLDRLTILVCHHRYHKPSLLARLLVNSIASFVLDTNAVPTSADIPKPPSTLPFRKDHFRGGGLDKGVAINGYLSHAPVLNAVGETAEGSTPPEAYPIFSAHIASVTTVIAMALTTNMTHSYLHERHAIRGMLSPAVDFRGLETLILHLDGISLRLSHGDLAFIGENWRNLRNLDLRFNTIITNEHLDVVQLNSIQYMTKPNLADRLKRVHLPVLDVRNFRNLMKYRQDTLTTLTSTVLYFSDHEVKEVCISLLAAYPNLTTVNGPGSASQWDKFAEVLKSIREKRRVEREQRDEWTRFDAMFAHRHP